MLLVILSPGTMFDTNVSAGNELTGIPAPKPNAGNTTNDRKTHIAPPMTLTMSIFFLLTSSSTPSFFIYYRVFFSIVE